jgi:hypothetical protein
MKKFFGIMMLLFIFNSCSVEEEPTYHYEILPVLNYEVPESFVLNVPEPIKVYYQRPSSCHGFQGFYFDVDGSQRTIAVQTIVSQSQQCTTYDNNIQEASFTFTPKSLQTYLFNFFKGYDEEGNAIYDIIEIPVSN